MKIAHVAPYSITFPLTSPNGRYSWVLQLASLQAANGHDVTIYCNPRSRVAGVRTVGLEGVPSDDKHANNLATFRLSLQGAHDIFHSHLDSLHYEVAAETDKPIFFTQHWWPSDTVIEFAKASPAGVWAVPPTRYMYEFDLQHGIASKGHIYHGIDLSIFRPPAKHEKNGRLLFVGRISPEKNLELALALAEQSGMGLDIVGKIVEKNQPYWETLQRRVDGQHIRYLGTKTPAELAGCYAAAQALIFPSSDTEAFGLVAIEAQACGTPVIMKRGGSRGELIEEGKTGFLCETLDDFQEAVAKAGVLRPEDCIAFAQRFSLRRMAAEYDALYGELTSGHDS